MKILIDGQTLATPEATRGIGVYFKNVLTAMVENDLITEWYLAVPNEECLKYLKPRLKSRIQPIVRESFDPLRISHEGYSCKYAFTNALQEGMDRLRIDTYWTPNPLMNNVIFPSQKLPGRFVVTVHDLIPMVFSDKYLNEWPKYIVEEYKLRLAQLGEWADDLIFDSRSTENDFGVFTHEMHGRGHTVYLGAQTYPGRTLAKSSEFKKSPYILVTGGFDYRKNMEGALRAFARFIQLADQDGQLHSLIKNLKLMVVCAYSPEAKSTYEMLACKLGVNERLVLTGYVTDEELMDLYQNANLFFFPSLYEGFGLPVLEAQMAGIPVVTSNVSSLPEVGLDHAYYCDPYDIENMAQVLHTALADVDNREQRVQAGIRHAREFTWGRAARDTVDILDGSDRLESLPVRPKATLAFVSPLPPQETGIANYSRRLLPYLAQYFDIDIFVEGAIDVRQVNGFRKSYELGQLETRYKNYDNILYHIGNNTQFHKKIYEFAWRIPGIVVLHDYIIHPFLYDAFMLNGGKNEELYREALKIGYGFEGERHFNSIKESQTQPDIIKFPMCHAIVMRSKAVIVHHHWVRKQFSEDLPVNVIPLFALPESLERDSSYARAFKSEYDILENEFVVGCYGFINPNKRLEKVLQAVYNLRNQGYPIKCVFAGEISFAAEYVNNLIIQFDLQDYVIVTGYINEEKYVRALSAADVVVNLRFPSMGEASATLAESFARGKATIVSNVNQYIEFPDKVCWKVDVGEHEVELLEKYIETLLRERLLREQLGRNARQFAENTININKIAKEYWRVLNNVKNG